MVSLVGTHRKLGRRRASEVVLARVLELHGADNFSIVTQDQSIPRTTAASLGFDVISDKMHTAAGEGRIHTSGMTTARPGLSVCPTVDPTGHFLRRQTGRLLQARPRKISWRSWTIWASLRSTSLGMTEESESDIAWHWTTRTELAP